MTCTHCGQPVEGVCQGEAPRFCCPGCRAVYAFIQQVGLGDYYRFRPEPSGEPVEESPSLAVFRDPEVARGYLFEGSYYCLLDGMHCAACGWLVERALGQVEGLDQVQVNYATQRLRFTPNTPELLVSALERVQQLGYRAIPYDPNRSERPRARADRMLLLRFGVAACAAGNVMLAGLALYSGADMDLSYRPLFHKLSFALTVPVVLFSAVPFWSGAWNALKQRQLTTDVSIALGLAITFLYSLVAAVLGHQHVYFDTVSMFVFVLLLGRLLEGAARSHSGSAVERLLSLHERTAWRWNGHSYEEVPSDRLAVGDRVQVRAGSRVPADGQVAAGACYVDESHLTGESRPRSVAVGDVVYGGSLSLDGLLEVELSQLGGTSMLAQVARLVESAQCTPGRIQRAADRVAAWLLPTILVLAGVTGCVTHDLDRAIAVLIITCPCALGIATPLVVSVAAGVAARRGLLFRDGMALETARQITHVVVDKTGTLTEGQLQLVSGPRDERLRWAASLESPCQHPLARALSQSCPDELLPVMDWQLVPGQGVEGEVEGHRLRLGRADYLGRPELDREALHTSVWLESDGEVVGRFEFADRLRAEAPEFIRTLQKQGLTVCLASGDREPVVAAVAQDLGLKDYRSQCLPLDKLAWVEQLQQRGAVVAFLGDGINDAPALRKANLGITVANGSELSWEVANLVLLRPGLAPAVEALELAAHAWTRLRVNLSIAVVYNALAIPAAALGWVTPLAAAVSMPLASLLVVGQSLLMLGYQPKETNHGRTLLSDTGSSGTLGVRSGPLLVGGVARPV